jgi:membrane protease YdiL (CAAX protease family)
VIALERSSAVPARPAAEASAIVAASLLLLARPALIRQLPALPVLLAVYACVLALSLAIHVRRDDAAMPAWLVTAVGCGAILAARRLLPPGVPMAAGATTITLNVAAAIAEEAFFRHAMYGTLARRGPVLAVAGSALAFAAFHVPAYGVAVFPVDLGAGLLLSWQRWASGRWEPAASTHAFANMIALLR